MQHAQDLHYDTRSVSLLSLLLSFSSSSSFFLALSLFLRRLLRTHLKKEVFLHLSLSSFLVFSSVEKGALYSPIFLCFSLCFSWNPEQA